MYRFFNYEKSAVTIDAKSVQRSLVGLVVETVSFLNAHPYVAAMAILIAQVTMTEACNICYNFCSAGGDSHRNCWAKCFCGGDL